MKCSINDRSCLYHACMSNDCQEKIVKAQGVDWGKGKCQETTQTIIKPETMEEQLYFSKVTQDYWTAKNQLQKEAKKIARQFERQVIKKVDLPEFKRKFKERIKQLNEQFHRCKPLIVDDWSGDAKDHRMHISGVTDLVMYKSVSHESDPQN